MIVSNIAFSLCALHASRAASELSPDISMSKSFFSNGQKVDHNGMHAQSGLGPPMLRMHTGLKMLSGCDTRMRIGSQIAHMRIPSAFAGTESPHPPPLHKRYVELILHLYDSSNSNSFHPAFQLPILYICRKYRQRHSSLRLGRGGASVGALSEEGATGESAEPASAGTEGLDPLESQSSAVPSLLETVSTTSTAIQ